MARWKYTLDVKVEFQQACACKNEIKTLVKAIIQGLKDFGLQDEVLDGLIADFEAYNKQKKQEADEFDVIWDRLYDWADQTTAETWPPSKLCWIKTF